MTKPEVMWRRATRLALLLVAALGVPASAAPFATEMSDVARAALEAIAGDEPVLPRGVTLPPPAAGSLSPRSGPADTVSRPLPGAPATPTTANPPLK